MNKTVLISLVVLFLLYVFSRIVFLFFPFWGLEYEDAFIYNDTSRLLFENYNFSIVPYKTQSCLDGSILNCYETGSFGGHLLTYPFIIATYSLVFGYSEFNAPIVSFIFSIILLFMLMKASRKWSEIFNISYSWTSPFILIAPFFLTPFIPLFHTSGVSETVSSVFVVGFFISIIQIVVNDFKFDIKDIFISIVFFLLAILTKRENLVLIFFVGLLPIVHYWIFKINILVKSYFIFLGLLILIGSLFFLGIDALGVENNESSDIEMHTFSFKYFTSFIIQFFKAIANINYWGIIGLIFIFSIVYSLVGKIKMNVLQVYALLIFVLYLSLYSSHYRSYFQVKYNDIDPFETLRYSVNFFPFVAIFLFALDIPKKSGIKVMRTKFGNYLLILLFPLFVFNLALTFFTRISMSDDEYYSRILPVELTLDNVRENDIIITDIPIVFHCYTKQNQHIVDSNVLTEERLTELERTFPNSDIFLMLSIDPSDLKDDRYLLKFDVSRFKEQVQKKDVYTLHKLN